MENLSSNGKLRDKATSKMRTFFHRKNGISKNNLCIYHSQGTQAGLILALELKNLISEVQVQVPSASSRRSTSDF